MRSTRRVKTLLHILVIIIRRLINRAFEATNIKHYTFHSFRHEVATRQFSKATTGAEIKEISRNLGHSNINTTMNIYQEVNDDYDDSFFKKNR